MKVAALLLALASSASAFAPVSHRSASTALCALDDMAGSTMPFKTFDPLGLADLGSDSTLAWFRAAELKHSRVSMLATVGFVVQEFVTIPGYTPVEDSTLGPTTVGLSAMLQIVFGVGIVEWWSNNGNVTMETMFSDPARVPGDIGFDPLGYGKKMSEEEMDTMKLKELNNGRLAMLAIGGMIHHNWVTGEPLF